MASSASVPVTEQPKHKIQISYDTSGLRTGWIQSGSISNLPLNVQEAIQREIPSPAHSDPTTEGWLRLAEQFPDHIILSSDIHRREPINLIEPPAPAIITRKLPLIPRGAIKELSLPVAITGKGEVPSSGWSGEHSS